MNIKLYLDGLLKISGSFWLGILGHELTHIFISGTPLVLILSPNNDGVAAVVKYGLIPFEEELAILIGFMITISALYYIMQENLKKVELLRSQKNLKMTRM